MKRTLKCFLETALLPLGNTMYVYGGGWNEEDTGAGFEACSMGLSPLWKMFFEGQNADYDFREHLCGRQMGLDCSGYVGWVIYNTLETENGRPGYVMKARNMAKEFADRGWGSFCESASVMDYRPGDIMSGKDHVWIALGQCSDGSVLMLHASPPGVMISGTVTSQGRSQSEAVIMAGKIMSVLYPWWHEKYPCYLKGASYLTEYDQFRWDLHRGILTDPDGYAIIPLCQLLDNLFSGVNIS
ncbi:MAG: hypothetical protein IKV45_02245 [Firmicutes bacterium]|nr:hypothetical protein [Bacillota bacterium]